MCYDIGGTMYTIKDQVADAIGAVIVGGAFIWLWAVATHADLMVSGF